jgi:hypothetical protein
VGLAETGLRSAQTGSQLPRGYRPPSGPPNDPGGRIVAWAQAPILGSGEPELLFLARPDARQIADEPGDGQIGGARPSAMASMMRGER